MKYLKGFFALALLLILSPIAFGEIQTTLPEKSIYNLGEKITPSISIKEDQSYEGFFKLYISCGNYSLQYYTTPLNFETGPRTQVAVPDLTLSKSMVGECNLKSSFESIDGNIIDSSQSGNFLVADGLDITISGNLEAKPGEKVRLLGEAQKHSNESIFGGEAEITFKDNKNEANISAGKFQYAIDLSRDTETGDFPVLISVTDKYGNYGTKTLSLKILPIPTRIENNLDNTVLMPGDTLRVGVTLYDHLSRTMNGTHIDVKAFGPDDRLIAEKDVQTLDYFELKTEKNQIPGTYFLLSRFQDARFEDVKEQSSFTIETVKKIAMTQEGNSVYVENVGNVKYG